MEIRGKIYKITHKLTGKCYIGQTIQKLSKRWAYHCALDSGCPYLGRAIKKYGRTEFSFELLAEYNNQKDLNNAEEYYIDFYNSLMPNGYNLRSGGNSGGPLHTETRAKISATLKKNPPFTGRHHSEETKAKMRKSLSGSNNPLFGTHRSEETKRKMSQTKKAIALSKRLTLSKS